MVWAAKVAHLAHVTRRGYWETLEYLEHVEMHYGRTAALLELELALAITIAESKAAKAKNKRTQ